MRGEYETTAFNESQVETKEISTEEKISSIMEELGKLMEMVAGIKAGGEQVETTTETENSEEIKEEEL